MSIHERQNRPQSLALLAAQQHLYSRAKGIRNVAIAVVLGVAILGLVASAVDNRHFTHVLPSLVLLSWFFDQRVLTTRERAALAEAAQMQEAFDCFVLDLPWPSCKGIERPTDDRVKQLAVARAKRNVRPLENWYPPSAIPTDPILAKVHCQRTNCWWEINLRRKWVGLGRMVFWGLLAVLLLLSASTGLTVAKLVGILASNIRVVAWGLNERDDQAAAIERLVGIHSLVSGFRADRLPSAAEIRGIQDAVFDHRRVAPPIPDWFYGWHRYAQEVEASGGLDS